jgi:hypothetical protein
MDITVLDLSAQFGLFALGAMVLNMLTGMLMAFHCSPHRSSEHHRFNYFRFPHWPRVLALAAAILHPAMLPCD